MANEIETTEEVLDLSEDGIRPFPTTLQHFTIRIERVVTQLCEVKVVARNLVWARAEAIRFLKLRSLETDSGWRNVEPQNVTLKVVGDEHETRIIFRSENPSLIVGRLVHSRLGWIFLTNVSSHGNGRTRRAVMKQAIPPWARKGTELVRSSQYQFIVDPPRFRK